MDYEGKVALVTGAASGIGLGIAKQCVKQGLKVMLADNNAPGLERETAQLAEGGATVACHRIDVTSDADWSALVARTLEVFGRIDLFFNNAGVSFNKLLSSCTPNDWAWIFDVNFWGQLKGSQAVLPVMIGQESGGHIAHTASFGAYVSPATMVPYSCTKAAVLAYAEGLANELAVGGLTKIRVSVVMPAYVVTNIQEGENYRQARYANPEDTSTGLDKFVWLKIKEAIAAPNPAIGAISAESAGDIILDQMKQGFFYIHTHADFTKAIAAEKWSRMVNDGQPVEPSSFMTAFYTERSKQSPAEQGQAV